MKNYLEQFQPSTFVSLNLKFKLNTIMIEVIPDSKYWSKSLMIEIYYG